MAIAPQQCFFLGNLICRKFERWSTSEPSAVLLMLALQVFDILSFMKGDSTMPAERLCRSGVEVGNVRTPGHPVSTPMDIRKPKIRRLMLKHVQGRPRQTPGIGRCCRRLDSHAQPTHWLTSAPLRCGELRYMTSATDPCGLVRVLALRCKLLSLNQGCGQECLQNQLVSLNFLS